MTCNGVNRAPYLEPTLVERFRFTLTGGFGRMCPEPTCSNMPSLSKGQGCGYSSRSSRVGYSIAEIIYRILGMSSSATNAFGICMGEISFLQLYSDGRSGKKCCHVVCMCVCMYTVVKKVS